MTDQPEALRLADRLTAPNAGPWDNYDAAAELRRLAAVDVERDALLALIANVRRCRYSVCTTICSSGYGWDIPRLNEVIDAANGGGNG